MSIGVISLRGRDESEMQNKTIISRVVRSPCHNDIQLLMIKLRRLSLISGERTAKYNLRGQTARFLAVDAVPRKRESQPVHPKTLLRIAAAADLNET